MMETQRLLLREMNPDDFQALFQVLGDPETMWHYPYTFDGQHVRDWIERNRNRYRKDGFGLWAVCLKDTGEMIGDCGLTLQNIKGEILPEIGFHIRRDCQRKGYAKEAARAVRDWAFRNTDYPALYSYCKYTNEPSFRTAESIGMRISWAEEKLGSREYAGWCLPFIEDALEKSNGIEIFGGDSAKESALLYADGMRQDIPERGAFVFYDCICQGSDGPVNWGHCGISLGDSKIIHAWDTVRIDDYREIEAMTALSGDRPRTIGWVPIERVLKQKP